MLQEKNYYIVIAITETNVSQVFTFIAAENENFLNRGDNSFFEIIPNPKTPIYPCYRIELKEELVNQYRTQLESFNAEIYESAEQYLAAYPPIETDENFI